MTEGPPSGLSALVAKFDPKSTTGAGFADKIPTWWAKDLEATGPIRKVRYEPDASASSEPADLLLTAEINGQVSTSYFICIIPPVSILGIMNLDFCISPGYFLAKGAGCAPFRAHRERGGSRLDDLSELAQLPRPPLEVTSVRCSACF